MRELVGSKNTIGQMASVLKKLQKATFMYYFLSHCHATHGNAINCTHNMETRTRTLGNCLVTKYLSIYKCQKEVTRPLLCSQPAFFTSDQYWSMTNLPFQWPPCPGELPGWCRTQTCFLHHQHLFLPLETPHVKLEQHWQGCRHHLLHNNEKLTN